MKIGDEVYIHGYIDEIRKGTYVDIVIIRNKGGYFGTDASEVILADRKTESDSENPNNSTISKMEQVDKDTNVRSKEPQTCENRECENYDTINDHCMFIEQCHYEPKTKPQEWWLTENSLDDFRSGFIHGYAQAKHEYEPKDEPQTDPCDGCVCDDGKHLMYCMNCKGIAWKTEPPKVEDEPQTGRSE